MTASDDCDADAGNHAEDGDTDEAGDGQPELPLLDAEDAAQVCELEQADGSGNHDRRQCTARKILEQIGCEHQEQRDGDGADHAGELRLRSPRLRRRACATSCC